MKNKKIVCLLLSALILFSMHSFAFAEMSKEEYGDYQYQTLDYAARIIASNYKFETKVPYLLTAALYEKLTNPEADLEDMITRMMSTLDEHSSYLTSEEYQRMINHSINGEFGGIGVSIMERSGRIVVVGVMEGSPAEKAGILPNDVIASVGGISVLGKSAEYLQTYAAGEIGTTVNIGIIRGDQSLSFDIIRAKIKDTTVYAEIDEGIGYIRVTRFNQTTAPDTKRALAAFDALGVDSIIIDIRSNPGGERQSAIDFCNLFIPKGVVASVHYLNEKYDEYYYSELENPKYKLAVLVNGDSASASELFAAAVKDTKAGIIIGETTYGKGTMQSIIPFPETGGALRLTVAEYVSACGNKVNEIGVTPDNIVHNKTVIHDTSYFTDLDLSSECKIYDKNPNVLAMEQRLDFLGYNPGTVDNVFDSTTEKALKTYQIYRNLSATGTLNLETALDLNNIDYENLEFTVDEQYEAAKSYLKTGKFE